MSDLARHVQGAIVLNGSTVSSIVKDSFSCSPEFQQEFVKAGGQYFASAAFTVTAKQSIRFQTHNLDLLSSPVAITSFKGLLQASDSVSGLGSGLVAFTCTQGIAVPRVVSAQKGQLATLEIEIIPTSSDGLTNPLTVGTSTETLGVITDAYTVGPLTINGTGAAGVQSINLDYGWNVMTTEGEDGNPFSKHAYADMQDPKIDVTLVNVPQATAARLNTGEITSSGAVMSFVKLVQGAVPSGGCKITMDQSLINCGSISGASPSTVQLNMQPVADAASPTNFFAFATYA